MKRLGKAFIMIIAGLGMFSISLQAQQKKAQYIGAAKCKMCHRSTKQGEQFGKWQAGPHAKAFAVLATEKAKKVAKKSAVKGDPQQASQCLKCHVTGYNAPAAMKATSFNSQEGVGCEACHGPGSLYKSMKVMKALRAGTQDASAVSFVKPNEKTCAKCHNEQSPTFKPFNYKERLALIAHPIPKAAK